MERERMPPGLVQVTSWGLKEMSGLFRHLAEACDAFEATGSLPPSLFSAPPTAPVPPAPRPQAHAQAQPQPQPRPSAAAQPTQPPPGPAAGVAGLQIPLASAKPRKKRKSSGESEGKRRRPPTGYNLFVRAKLESLKREGTYAQFADSKAAFKAAVEDWRTLPEEQKRLYTQQAGQLADAAQAQSVDVKESPEAGSVANSQPSESIEPGPELGTSLAQGPPQPGVSLQAPQHLSMQQAAPHLGMPSLQGPQQAGLQGLQHPVQPYPGAQPGQVAELPQLQLQLHPPAQPRLPPRASYPPQ